MPIATSTSVVLKFDIPEYGLKTGDVCTIVHVYDQAEAYEIEFVSLNGLRPLPRPTQTPVCLFFLVLLDQSKISHKMDRPFEFCSPLSLLLSQIF